MQNIPTVIVIFNSIAHQVHVCRDEAHAEKTFLEKCAMHLPEFDKMTATDRALMVADGSASFGYGDTNSICLAWGSVAE